MTATASLWILKPKLAHQLLVNLFRVSCPLMAGLSIGAAWVLCVFMIATKWHSKRHEEPTMEMRVENRVQSSKAMLYVLFNALTSLVYLYTSGPSTPLEWRLSACWTLGHSFAMTTLFASARLAMRNGEEIVVKWKELAMNCTPLSMLIVTIGKLLHTEPLDAIRMSHIVAGAIAWQR